MLKTMFLVHNCKAINFTMSTMTSVYKSVVHTNCKFRIVPVSYNTFLEVFVFMPLYNASNSMFACILSYRYIFF